MKKMYLKILLLSLSLYTGTVTAQVKIAGGATAPLPNASSQLDVEASDRGILIPRLSLTSSTDAATITNGNVVSLLVYNTATVADITEGYHYWDGVKWQRLALNSDIVAETVTTLVANADGTYTYVSEDGTITNINTITPEPWYGTDDNARATDNTEDMYVMGNVGIGVNTPGAKLDIYKHNPDGGNPLLHVNGAGAQFWTSSTVVFEQNLTSGGEDDIVLKLKDGSAVGPTVSGNGYLLKAYGDAPLLGTSTTEDEVFAIRTDGRVAMLGDKFYLNGANGRIGLGTTTPTQQLDVVGNIKASGSLISGTTTYPDYVFENYLENEVSEINKAYSFKTLEEVEQFIKINGHLPGVTGINELEKTEDGYVVNMSVLSIQTLEKVEELYLHTIEQEDKINHLEKEVEELKQLLQQVLKEKK